MESFEHFMEQFKKFKRERNSPNLTDILKNGPSYFQNLSTNEIDLVLSVFLSDETGLLNLLGDASNRSMEGSIIEGFKLLNFIVQQFYWSLDQYIIRIKKVCQSAIISKSSSYVKTSATNCFETLVKTCRSHQLELNQTVETFVDKFHLCNDKERSKYFKALGSIAKYCPEAISPRLLRIIFEQIINDFDENFAKTKGSQPAIFAIYLDVLDNLMTNLSLVESPERLKSHYNKLYQRIKESSSIDLTQKIKFVSRAAIGLLGNHMDAFSDHVYNDALFWHDTLLKWTKLIGDNGVVASNALSAYYRRMGIILKSSNTATGRQIFEKLMAYFKENFTNENVNLTTLRLSIRGFGYMAGACKSYSTENVVDMFSLIAQRTTMIYAKKNETDGSLENIAYYQVALSEILLHLSEVLPDQLSAVLTLSLILVKRFPELPITSHSLAIHSLMKTMYNVKQGCGHLYEDFVKKLVYEGIIWSCSHMLYIDAETESEMENSTERPICYKDYLPLWNELLNRDNMMKIVHDSTISMQIFDDMIATCVRLIKKLNLDVKSIDTSCETEGIDIAVNDTDFRVFVNLVDLFVAILERTEPDSMESKTNWFFREIIVKSNINPLISGFYKLIRVVLKLYNSTLDTSEEKLLEETSKLLSKYLSDTVDKLSSFSGELQMACFDMIFETPISMAENMLEDLASVFKTAFSLGQSNFHVAQSALNTLEKWNRIMSGERINQFLIQVVPCLETFLHSDRSTVESMRGIFHSDRKAIRNIVLADHEKTVDEFQRRILLFFGSLNTEVTSNFAVQPSSGIGNLQDEQNLLPYTLLYQDIRPEIYLDTILSRTIELASESTDRQTRVLACEVLHSIVIIMLGRTPKKNPGHLLPVFRRIFPALLKLGSDSDQVIQQLFYPLTIQLTHWYSSKVMEQYPETAHLIEVLFELLTYESNVALNDFCGVCLAEFVKWSIKQSTDDAELQAKKSNIEGIMSKITNFALHPSMQKRIGAAIAFNYLYTILREKDVIIDMFWLELLYCFVKSLDGCNSVHIFKSLKHIERVIASKYELLNYPTPNRRKPTEFEGILLKDAVDWLVVQCGSLDWNYRSKTMELLEVISRHVHGFGSVEEVLKDYITRHNVRGFNNIILKDLYPKIEILSAENIKPLLRTLDCYIWIINGNLLSLDILFTDKNAKKDMIFNCVVNFIYLINVKREENTKFSGITKEYQDLCVLKCQIILRIFLFLKTLLDKIEKKTGTNSLPYIPTFLWNSELYSIISMLIFQPEVFGFDFQNLDVTESLSSSLRQLLDTLIQKLDDKHLLRLREAISDQLGIKSQEFIDLNEVLKKEISVELKNYLKGLILLEKFDESGKLYKRPLTDTDSANKVMQIFNLLKKEQYGEKVTVNLERSQREYLEYLLEFLFLKFETNMITTLLDIFSSESELDRQNSATKIFHGKYFMSLFSAAVFRSLLRNLSRTMDVLLHNSLKENFDTVLSLLEDMLTYVKNNRKDFAETLQNSEKDFVNRFPTIHSLINWNEKRKDKVIRLYSLLVQVSSNPSNLSSEPNDLYSWIMRELFGYFDLKYKTRMLESFLPCIVDETDHKKGEITRCLHKLKTDYYPAKLSDLGRGSTAYFDIIASFQTLLRHLPRLKSITLFESVINLTIGNVEYLWDDASTEYLIMYFDRISVEDSHRALQILYKYFMNTEDFTTRLEILNKLLLKCIHGCKGKVIEQFFEQNIKEIYEIVSQDLCGDGTGLKNLIVSKIGCYNLLEIMFAKIPLEKISGANSTIEKNAVGKMETGKGLFQALNNNVLNVRKLKSDNNAPKELVRLLHCAAYNCSISIVSLKCEERFYVLPFAEDKNKGQIIWKNIIDMDRRYEFKQDFKEIPKEYKKLIHIRKQSNLKGNRSFPFVQSYNLAASTLNEDLACIDLYECNLNPRSIGGNVNEEEMMSLSFESDDINNHECMASICGVITHMVSRKIFNPPNDGEEVSMPKWMRCFYSSLITTPVYNVTFFMIKIILNMQEVFKPYAKYFLSPTLKFLISHFRSYHHMNYVIKDILVMLIDWHHTVVPTQENDKQSAQNLLEMLIDNGDSNQRHIYKYNVEIINMLTEAWRSCLKLPRGILQIRNATPKFIVRMILIFLANGKQEAVASRRDILEYLMPIFEDPDEEMILHVCAAFGLILEFLESKNEEEAKKWIIDSIRNTVIDKPDKDHNKYIKCIHEIHRYYPGIILHCFQQLTCNFFKIDDANKEKCLDLFSSALPHFTEKEIITELGFVKFQDILLNKISTCQLVALKIVKKLSDILKPTDYLPFTELTVPYPKDACLSHREMVLDIFIAVYKKYDKNIEDNIAVSKLNSLSRNVLLSGLLDVNEDLQTKLLNFWIEDGNLPDKSIERLLEILHMYDPDLELSYLPILPLMMLHLVSKDPGYMKEMFESRNDCIFEDYNIAIPRRSQHAILVAPLFTPSLVTQMSQYYSNSNPTFSRFNQSLNRAPFLQATQSLQFKPTVPADQSFFQSSDNEAAKDFTESIFEEIAQPSKNKKSRRILQNTTALRDNIRQNQISANIRRNEMLKDKDERQRNKIQIYRSYRIGDFPDIQIPHSSLIKPLQELVKHDQIIARDLTVAIYCSMLTEMKAESSKKDFLQNLSSKLKFILDETHGSKPLIATVLEIILNSYQIKVSSNVIARVSKSSGLLSLGALLLEEKMISGYTSENLEPAPKIPKRMAQTYNEETDWLQLANIYKSMNDLDIVQSIFGCEKFGKELKEATFAQAASEWMTAKVAYEKAYEMNEGLIKDYCQESLFVCLANISNWEQINNLVESEFEGDFNSVWKTPMNENWMASWALQGQIHAMVQDECSDKFLTALNDWVNTRDKLLQLKTLYGEEMAIFYTNQKPEFAEHCLMSGLDKIRQEWKHLNPLYYEQKITKYLKLRGISDIKTYLKESKDASLPNIENMIKLWNNSGPADQDNLLLWDKHIAYRLYFFRSLTQLLEDKGSNETINMINTANVRQCLNVVRVAYAQRNLHFMKKYLGYSEEYCEDVELNSLEWHLSFAKYQYLRHLDLKPQEKKIKAYVSSWVESHKLVSKNCADKRMRIDVRQHIGNLVIHLQKLLINSEPISTILLQDPTISQYVPIPAIDDQEHILKQLSDYCLINLKKCYEISDAKNKASCYLKVSKYCHSMNVAQEISLDLSQEFVHSTLSAMSYGDLEASQYFPRLLNLDYSNNPELRQTFETTSKNVETWMFLKWQAQLLSHIDSPISSLIIPILLRLAEVYPNSFTYAFRMTKEMNKSLSTHSTVRKLSETLSENKDLESFLEAMKYVVQPELYLKYNINELEANTSEDLNIAVNNLLTTVYPPVENSNQISLRGEIYKDIARFADRIKEIPQKGIEELPSYKAQINYDLDELLKHRSRSEIRLKQYSPWLYELKDSTIEVPGQYAGDKKPLPQHHAKIVRIYPIAKILPSQRRPIKITMLGNDGKNYDFLVKFGEDLRTDERIEQLFMLMNKILQGDAVCRRRLLLIDTYLVIPLSGSLGLIQWVDNTKSLHEIIKSILTKSPKTKNERDKIIVLYNNWMSSATSGKTIAAAYKSALMRYGRQEVTAEFNFLKSKIDGGILRKALRELSPSSESYFALKHNFITSYATICVAQWILGIGDRNLSNTLISYSSGRALGIDFGYSFDAAIDISVPELMPFRLTPQILGLLQPFDENGLLKVTMINVLRAIKRDKDPLLACMDIFIQEPSLDWLARKKVLEDRREDSLDVKWYPKNKINIVSEKLNGAKPSKLTLQQVKDRYGSTEYFSKFIDIVNGSDDGLQSRIRSRYRDENLSVEEQVECLLDQATDPNILGRAFPGWEPWM